MLALFQTSQQLESVLLAVIDFTHEHSRNPGSQLLALPNLKRLHLKGASLVVQEFVLDHLHLPKHCLLTLSDFGNWDYLKLGAGEFVMMPIHTKLFSTLDPRFTHCELERGSAELLEEETSGDRCRVQLKFCICTNRTGLPAATDPSGLASLIFSNVRTLSISWEEEPILFSPWCSAVETLILRGASPSSFPTTELLPDGIFPTLKEVRLSLHEPHLLPANDARLGLHPIAIRILDQIRSRKEQSNGTDVSRIARLVLYGNQVPVAEKTLEALRELVTVEIGDQDDYSVWHRGMLKRCMADWWPVRPHPLRAWLSAAAARCPACNGDLEANSTCDYPEEDLNRQL